VSPLTQGLRYRAASVMQTNVNWWPP